MRGVESPNGKSNVKNGDRKRYIEEVLPLHVVNLKDLEKKRTEERSNPYLVWLA